MKRLSKMLLAILAAAALMQWYCTHVELKYTREALARELKSSTRLLVMNNERVRRQTEKLAGLETKLKATSAKKSESTNNAAAAATLY